MELETQGPLRERFDRSRSLCPSYAMSERSPYAPATRCPELTEGPGVQSCYAMPGTDLGKRAISLCACYAMAGPDEACGVRTRLCKHMKEQTPRCDLRDL
eukprot:2246671-Rhodomonas_salina.1